MHGSMSKMKLFLIKPFVWLIENEGASPAVLFRNQTDWPWYQQDLSKPHHVYGSIWCKVSKTYMHSNVLWWKNFSYCRYINALQLCFFCSVLFFSYTFNKNTYLIMLLSDVTLAYLHAATICNICTLTKHHNLQLWSI